MKTVYTVRVSLLLGKDGVYLGQKKGKKTKAKFWDSPNPVSGKFFIAKKVLPICNLSPYLYLGLQLALPKRLDLQLNSSSWQW